MDVTDQPRETADWQIRVPGGLVGGWWGGGGRTEEAGAAADDETGLGGHCVRRVRWSCGGGNGVICWVAAERLHSSV